MAIYAVRRAPRPGETVLNGIRNAVVEAANAGAAITAANAITGVPAGYFTSDNSTTADIETAGNFSGSAFGTEVIAGATS